MTISGRSIGLTRFRYCYYLDAYLYAKSRLAFINVIGQARLTGQRAPIFGLLLGINLKGTKWGQFLALP